MSRTINAAVVVVSVVAALVTVFYCVSAADELTGGLIVAAWMCIPYLVLGSFPLGCNRHPVGHLFFFVGTLLVEGAGAWLCYLHLGDVAWRKAAGIPPPKNCNFPVELFLIGVVPMIQIVAAFILAGCATLIFWLLEKPIEEVRPSATEPSHPDVLAFFQAASEVQESSTAIQPESSV
jgi:hypothetical protein